MRRKLRKSLSWLLTVSMIFSLVFGAIPTASAALNDTEFHIMDMDKIKEIVAEECNVNAADVTIHGIFVHGERNDGEPGTATGGVRVQTITNNRFASGAPGDEGFPGTNGILSGYDGWNVLNTVEVIKNDSVDSITIFARTGTWDAIAGSVDRWVGGENLPPVTLYLTDDAITVTEVNNKLITEISVENATTTPPEEATYSYTIKYYFVDEDETITPSTVVDTFTGNEITQSDISPKAFTELSDHPSGNYILDKEKSSKSFTWTQDKQVFEVYYALDANENGTPDYQEQPVITQFDKELVTAAPGDVIIPEGVVVTYPAAGETVEVPVNSTVTLMYQFIVEGKADTQFTISDDGATAVGGNYTNAGPDTITGTIPEDGTATIYAIKTFQPENIDQEENALINNAAITVGSDLTIADDEEQASESVPAKEGAPIATEDVLNRDLDNSFVTIHCTTAETSFNHEEKTYGLLQNGYTISGVTRDSDTDPWKVTVTISLENAEVYVNAYEEDNGSKEHTLNPGQETQAIVLNWDTTDKKWEVAPVSEAPVVYTVTCDDEHNILQFDSEYHIMDLDAIKKAVVDTVDGVDSAANVGIFAIYVHGTTDDNVSGTATGRFDTDEIYYDDGILGMGAGPREPDEGVAWNGYHPNDGNDYWLVQNTSESVNNDTITGITIYYKNNGTEGNVLIPYTDLDVNHLEGLSSHITEIYLHTISDEPEPEPGTYTLTYNYNDASDSASANTENAERKYATGVTATLKTDANTLYDTKDDGVVVVGWTKDKNNYTKSTPATEKPTGMVTSVTFSDNDIIVYAVWAQDADDDGKPDYDDEDFAVQNVYVYAKPTGSGENGALTEAERAYLKETYDLTLNSDGYCVLGKLTNVLLPKASEQTIGANYFEQYEAVITAALDSFAAHKDAPADVKTLIDTLTWNHLSVASGAEGYEDEAPSSAGLCWHLDGDLDVNAKYDLTFNANGGGFPNDQPNPLVIENLVAGTYGFNTTNLPNYAEPTHDSVDGVEVLFVGWTTEEPTGTDVERIYQAGDTDVPATVSSVTVPTNTQLWAVWGYDKDGDGTADVNEVIITPADITIYTGGEGYLGVTTNTQGEIVNMTDSGLPQPGYHIDMPAKIQTWLGSSTAADLAKILQFEHNVKCN